MNNAVYLTLAAAICVPAISHAQTFEFSGAELSYDFREFSDDFGEYDDYNYRASAEALIIGQVTTQLDLFQSGYNGEEAYSGYTIHAGYMVAPGTVIGAFIGNEDWDFSDYRHMGLEVDYISGPISVEAAYLAYEQLDSMSPFEATMFRIDADYEVIPGLFAVSDLTVYSEDNFAFRSIGIGASYDIFEGVYAEANFNSVGGDYEGNVIGFEVGYRFGGGTTFGARDWNGMLTIF